MAVFVKVERRIRRGRGRKRIIGEKEGGGGCKEGCRWGRGGAYLCGVVILYQAGATPT